MRSKKNGFWNFILSFMPGCSEMYMGFMKMGLSLMVAFWGIVVVAVILNLGPIMLFGMIVWFYSFFHARNLYHLPDEIFATQEDKYLYSSDSLSASGQKLTQKYRKVIAIILIVLGIALVLKGVFAAVSMYLPDEINAVYNHIGYYVPQVIVGIGIIVIGKLMIDGKKKELYHEQALNEQAMNQQILNTQYVDPQMNQGKEDENHGAE